MEQEKLIERKIKDVQGINFVDIKGTPFIYMEENDKKYIICGNVRLETTKTEEETTEWLKEKPWEAISLLQQAIYYQISKTE